MQVIPFDFFASEVGPRLLREDPDAWYSLARTSPHLYTRMCNAAYHLALQWPARVEQATTVANLLQYTAFRAGRCADDIVRVGWAFGLEHPTTFTACMQMLRGVKDAAIRRERLRTFMAVCLGGHDTPDLVPGAQSAHDAGHEELAMELLDAADRDHRESETGRFLDAAPARGSLLSRDMAMIPRLLLGRTTCAVPVCDAFFWFYHAHGASDADFDWMMNNCPVTLADDLVPAWYGQIDFPLTANQNLFILTGN